MGGRRPRIRVTWRPVRATWDVTQQPRVVRTLQVPGARVVGGDHAHAAGAAATLEVPSVLAMRVAVRPEHVTMVHVRSDGYHGHMNTPSRAVTLGRQSKAREDDGQGSPEAQRLACRAFVDARAWEFIAHYEDVGASGYDPKAERPGLTAALSILASQKADILVVWKLDRLTRRGVAEAVRLADQISAYGAAFVSVSEPFLDTSTPIGRGIFALFAAMAEQESDNISRRSKATKELLRRAGSLAGGRAPYGFRSEMVLRQRLSIRVLIPQPDEAAVVVEIAERVMRGESVASVARMLNARGTLTRAGAEWTTGTLGRLLRAPTLAGYLPAYRNGRNAPTPRDAQGRVLLLTDQDGLPMATHEPILEPIQWLKLLDELDSRPAARGRSATPSLLGGAGLLQCGECGGGLAADRRGSGGTYRCMKHRRGSALCSGTAVSLPHADEYVAGAVMSRVAALDVSDPNDARLLHAASDRFAARIGDPRATERVAYEHALTTAMQAVERLDDDRAAGLFEGDVGAMRYARQVRALTDRIDEASRNLKTVPAQTEAMTPWLDVVAASADPDQGPLGPGSAWDAWDVAERRSFLNLFLDAVIVNKATGQRGHGNRGPLFRGNERLTLVWAR